MDDTLDFFAALDHRDAAIAEADEAVSRSLGGDELVGRVTDRIMKQWHAGATFSVDDIGIILDEMQVPKDGTTRRRIVGTIINRGKDKLWEHAGYISSRDPRRNARPVAIWRRRSIHDPMRGVPQPARLTDH
jgi:hypothetical protein